MTFFGGKNPCSFFFRVGVNNFGEGKHEEYQNGFPPGGPEFHRIPPPLKRGVEGGWVLAVLSGLFFVVAQPKKMKGEETQKQAEKSEKRQRNARRGRETRKHVEKSENT